LHEKLDIAVLNFDRLRRVSCVALDSLADLQSRLAGQGYRIFVLDGRDIKDTASFFANSAKVLPQDPPLGPAPNWDSWLDSVWGGLDALGAERVALLWTDVNSMLDGGLPDLLVAVECLLDLTERLSNPEMRITDSVSLRVFLLGNGRNFPRL
jgi:hypothetical protein